MCTVSNSLRLCTCDTESVSDLEHSWALKKKVHKGEWTIGEALMPYNLKKEEDDNNKRILRDMLNAGNCFDKEMSIKNHDVLILRFSVKKDKSDLDLPFYGNYLAYAFEYVNGKWKSTYYDPFQDNLDLVRGGKIENPFLKP